MNLHELGWTDFFENQLPDTNEHWVPARVIRHDLSGYQLIGATGEWSGTLPGRFHFDSTAKSQLPTVGDWVLIEPLDDDIAVIRQLLERKTQFSRKEGGDLLEEQIIAANIDIVFIVSGLDHNFNLNRIERYLVLARQSGARPYILLNKLDICTDPDEKLSELAHLDSSVDIALVSGLTGDGLRIIKSVLTTGVTGALLGSSGVGKSTIINALLETSHFETGEVRESDSRGRHTTSHRELVLVPGGGMLIDTPGMRELQFWAEESSIDANFADIEALALTCKFADCAHREEPGCAVKNAIDTEELDAHRLSLYFKMLQELKHLAGLQSIRARQDRKSDRKRRSRAVRKITRHKKKG